MKNKTIYVNGCSFAYGIGIDFYESRAKELRFSKTLCDSLGVVEDNRAIPGSCNARISRRTVVDLIKSKPELAIVIWSDPARFEFIEPTSKGSYKYPADTEQVRPLSIYNYPRHQRHAFLSYYENISSTNRDVLYTLQNMLSVKVAADMLDIPCIQIPFKGTFYRELMRAKSSKNPDYINSLNEHIEILSSDQLVFGLNEDISFDSICGADVDKGMLSKLPNQQGHPNKESHDILSDWMLKLISDRNLI